MGNVNRKATKSEMAHIRAVIQEAYPDLIPVFGGHSAYGGHRAPRDHTISFRRQDRKGKMRSNVVWLLPGELSQMTASRIQSLVEQSNGK